MEIEIRDAKNAREMAITYKKHNSSDLLCKFSNWIESESDNGSLEGWFWIDRDNDKLFSEREIDYISSLGYNICYVDHMGAYKVEW